MQSSRLLLRMVSFQGALLSVSALLSSKLSNVSYRDCCRYSLWLHALCVSKSHSFRNAHHWYGSLSDCITLNFLNIWKKWKNIILLTTTRTLNLDMVLPVRTSCDPHMLKFPSSFFFYRQNLGLCIQHIPSGMISVFNHQINFWLSISAMAC